MRRRFVPVLLLAAVAAPTLAFAHCQIPCGIYGDEMRFDMMREDLTTVEKAMTQIAELGGQGDKDFNQIVRWVTNKEEHAGRVMNVVSEYFFAQRIKPVEEGAEGYENYAQSLRLCHQLLADAMKCKQTTDGSAVNRARQSLEAFQQHYFQDKEHDHE